MTNVFLHQIKILYNRKVLIQIDYNTIKCIKISKYQNNFKLGDQMSSISINGGKYLPDNFKKVDTEGKDIETFLKENQDKIKTNFRDEIYVEFNKDLYVAEFKNFPQSELKKEKISFIDMPGAEIKLIDDEMEKHPISKVTINGVTDPKLKKFIEETFDIKNGSKVTIDDIIGKLKDLQDKGKNKFLNIDVVPTPAPGGKAGEVDIAIQVVENPKDVTFSGVAPEDAKKLRELFQGDLTKENIQKGIDKVKDYFNNHPTKMLPSNPQYPSLTWTFDDKGNLNFKVNVIDLPSKANVNVVVQNNEGRMVPDSMTADDKAAVDKAFKAPLSQKNIEDGIKSLSEYYGKKGMMLVNPRLNINEKGELNVDFMKVKAPQKMTVTGMEVFDADDIKKHFKQPLSLQSIDEGTEAVKKMYKDAGYVLTGPNEGVSVDTDGNELRININVAKFDGFEVFGNPDTKDNTITRELGDIKAGKPLNINDVEKGVARLRKTGLFKNAGYNLVMGQDNKVKVNLIVQEQKNNEFSIFGGYSVGGGIFGGGGVTFGNLGGTGKSLAIKGEAGTKRLGGSISYSDPWAFDKKVGFGTSLYAYRWEGPQTTEFRVGNTTSFSVPLGKDYLDTKWTLNPSLRTEYIGIGKEFSSSGTGNDFLIMPKLGINYSNVDNPTNPKEGTKAGVSVGLGTGSATFGQLDGNVKQYIPLTKDKKLTLNLGLNAGGQVGNVPYYEQFNSFNTASVYGRASDGAERGTYYAVGSANLKYNVWGPFSLIAGTTVGGIGKNITDLGAGGGIEVDLMGIPISVTAGARYNPVTKQSDTAINFNIFKVDF